MVWHATATAVEDEPWREVQVAIPKFPQDSDLLRIPPQPIDTFKVFVDAKSVTRADDGVMRMTFVIESPTGVRNVVYDGIRCATAEYKTYAIGTPDKRMQELSKARWQVIGPIAPNNYRRHLFQTLVCRKLPIPTPAEFIQGLKGAEYTGFDS
ncbi:MAG: CNP1-like family protein [Pseudomonadota bacterium]|nr:MAG: CNP1-like family protein [Pseudomonadota bacterium]